MGLGLGIISTAHINRLVIPGAHASDKVDLIAVASRGLKCIFEPIVPPTISDCSNNFVIRSGTGPDGATP